MPVTLPGMHVVSVSDLSHGYDGRVLFEGLSFGLSSDDRVAIVGPNGSGKSTLLELVAGRVLPDAGGVVVNNRARITFLSQRPDMAEHDLAGAIAAQGGGVADHEAEAILDRLQIDPDVPVGSLSGGQRRRVALARTLLVPSDLLVLDEPTNHLDAETVSWLEEELGRRASGLLFVTHDRLLLERLTTRMLDLHDTPTWVDGTYGDVLEARVARAERRDRAEQRRRNLWRKELAWLRRGPKARTSKPKFRVEQALALSEPGDVVEERDLELGTGRRRLGSRVLEAHGLTKRYGDRTVVDGVDLALGPGDRIGLVGPNGAGKTTLLRLLTGDLAPDAGRVEWGETVQLGVYEQEATTAPSDVAVLDTVRDIAEWIPLANGERLTASALAERFGFTPALQRAAVANLSGGERRRLALLHLLVDAPNVIVLDEPTNDLDIDTLQRLEDHLDGFRGTLVVASHDRYLLDRLTDELVAIRDGTLHRHLDWDDYRSSWQPTTSTGGSARGTSVSKQENRERQRRRREVRALEQRMDRARRAIAALEAQLADVAADYERAAALDRDLRLVRDELQQVEDEWLEASLALEG